MFPSRFAAVVSTRVRDRELRFVDRALCCDRLAPLKSVETRRGVGEGKGSGRADVDNVSGIFGARQPLVEKKSAFTPVP